MTVTVVSMPKLSIARLEASELDEAAELIHRCWHDTYRRELPSRLRSQRTQDYWLSYLRERRPRFWLARYGRRPVGLAGTASNCIDDLWIAQRHRRRGVGRRLLETVMKDLAVQGFEFAQAGCEGFNTSAIGFFRHLGWELIGTEPLLGLVPGRQVEAMVFSKSLGESRLTGTSLAT